MPSAARLREMAVVTGQYHEPVRDRTTVPATARTYGYFLGGHDNFAANGQRIGLRGIAGCLLPGCGSKQPVMRCAAG